MLEIFLKDPGIIFRMASGKVVRTPIKFIINDNERALYESLIKVSPIQNFTIESTDKQIPEKKIRKNLSKARRNIKKSLNLSINLQ